MHWFSTKPTGGKVEDAGLRRDCKENFTDGDAVCGVNIMYDAENGIILTAGGAPNYHYWFNAEAGVDPNNPKDRHRANATTNAFEIQLGGVAPGGTVHPKKVTSMIHQRIFANAVIFPNGEIFVVGGQSQGEPFRHETWQPAPEIYTPSTKNWGEATQHSTPRVYHSWALLLPDATVLVGGGGLSANSDTNHYDAQIYHPDYLFTPNGQPITNRPKIDHTDKQTYKVGEKITITTTAEVDGASLIRYSAATHALNNDVRRIILTLVPQGNASPSGKIYTAKIPDSAGVALPGYWMLFVLQKNVPSNATTVQILAA